VLIRLEPGQELGDHQVHENAYIVVVDGHLTVEAGDESLDVGPGVLVRFDEKERHRVSTAQGARVLMILAPWPGRGHYRGSQAREDVAS
jgi:quercetin dioxygenase-like cupin family protein